LSFVVVKFISPVVGSSSGIQECKVAVKSVAKPAEYREVVMFVTKLIGVQLRGLAWLSIMKSWVSLH